MPKTLITKDVFKEGGLGLHVLKNVLHGGQVELHPAMSGQRDPVTGFDLPKTLITKVVCKVVRFDNIF